MLIIPVTTGMVIAMCIVMTNAADCIPKGLILFVCVVLYAVEKVIVSCGSLLCAVVEEVHERRHPLLFLIASVIGKMLR